MPSRTVTVRAAISKQRRCFCKAQCATVMLTPLLSKINVFKAGIPQVLLTAWAPSNLLLSGLNSSGQSAIKSGHKIICVIGSTSPANCGTTHSRLKNNAPKKQAKKNTSDTINQVIPQRNERSDCSLNRPCLFSWITVPNQPHIIRTTIEKPRKKT